MKKKCCVIGGALLGFLWLHFENNHITRTNIKYTNDKLPSLFDGYTVLHVSDLHNKEFGHNQSKLIDKTKSIKPDIIVITGDFIDSNRPNMDISMTYIREAIKIAPIYYVPGNHESRFEHYEILVNKLHSLGVNVLDNISIPIYKEDQNIFIAGIQDPSFVSENTTQFDMILDCLKTTKKNFSILLSHRPEKFNVYVKHNFDLVFTGHAHGGQVRLPFVGGLLSPNQGFLPKYTSGIYQKFKTSMIVSRGLGNSSFPFRVFNTPELVVVTLESPLK
ncbi:metallophosphoesterase [Alkalibaculum sp. M08DMB]|uniref:Metallophosphoesterase n=1 Tax=Alkalibaculum sporogenes TaxID=2655001 RepID=A0A6A7K8V1_9FIRM|nr:metallophosphoesterase [Alkalibaculum sporogenes]MPW25785.1 metallophosphoesterase [Alkalibaculum sporogenes]